MDQCNWIDVLGQASVSDAGAIFREYMRDSFLMPLPACKPANVPGP